MTEKEKKEPGEISRREFLKDAGLIVGGAAIGSAVILAACGGDGDGSTATITKTVTSTVPGGTITTTAGEVTKTVTTTAAGGTTTVTKTVAPDGEVPAAENVVKFTVNGYPYEVSVEPSWTLQHLLHDKLGWRGIKDMCTGCGACGSCTVIVDGRPILSCMTLAIECDGKTMETSEHLGMTGHPLVEAYQKNYCMQCGYCTPGFVLTAKALLDRNPNPTEADIREALAGNLCRCGTYPKHIVAVLEAAKEL